MIAFCVLVTMVVVAVVDNPVQVRIALLLTGVQAAAENPVGLPETDASVTRVTQ